MAGPTITAQPTNQYAAVGGTATFSVSATASAGSLTYQWYKGPASAVNTWGSTATTNLTASANVGIYNSGASLTANAGLVSSVTIYLPSTVWSYSGTQIKLCVYSAAGALLGTTGIITSGMTVVGANTFPIIAPFSVAAGVQLYPMVIGDGYINVYLNSTPTYDTKTNSSGTLTSPPATISPGGDPAISNGAIYISINATSVISGATSASYTTPTLDYTYNGGSYSVVVTDSNGSVTSNSALLTISGGNLGAFDQQLNLKAWF